MENTNASEELLRAVECPCCLEYMRKHIYICLQGHSICDKCWDWVQSCPTCRGALSRTRNYAMESMVQNISFPCDNSEFGCRESFPIKQVSDHRKICSFRIHKCKLGRLCRWTGRIYQIEKHALEHHKKHVLLGNENLIVWKPTSTKSEVTLILAHEEMFYLHRKSTSDKMYFVLQYIGKSEDIVQYYYEITVYSDQYANRKLTLTETCQDDLSDDIREIMHSGFAVEISFLKLTTFQNDKGNVTFKINIKTT